MGRLAIVKVVVVLPPVLPIAYAELEPSKNLPSCFSHVVPSHSVAGLELSRLKNRELTGKGQKFLNYNQYFT